MIKYKRLLREESGGVQHKLRHTFEIQQGDNKIVTLVEIAVTAQSDDVAKRIADRQMTKVMAYMRSHGEEDQGGSSPKEDDFKKELSTVKPSQARVSSMPGNSEEQEEEHPQQSARDFWKSKGFAEDARSKSLSRLTPGDIENLVKEAFTKVR